MNLPSEKRKQKISNLFDNSSEGEEEQEIIPGVKVTTAQYEKIVEKVLFESEAVKI